MPMNFTSLPDWSALENQGANVAVADLDHDGVPDLVVLRVDHQNLGPNRGFYRVGRKLDRGGNVVGGWGPWVEIPHWGSRENQGAGVAVADFGVDGLGLVVFQVRHLVPGPNKGLYSVGHKLDAMGNVTGGWTPWREIPDWISWRDHGAAIAVADLDADGRPELFVFHIDDFHTDNPMRPNKGFYRVGHALTPDGVRGGWSNWFDVDWFSWFNQGAGIAVTDLDGDGRPEIVVFQIDNPPQENAGFCRVGWRLDERGQVRDGWGPWGKFDGWGSSDDGGGGFALAAFGSGRPRAVILHADRQLKAGLFAITDLTLDIDTAAAKGIWRLLPYPSQVLPVHAGLLHTGKVLFFAGSGNSAFRFTSADFGNEARQVFTSVVWDPVKSVFDSRTFTHPPTLRRANGSVVDFFCCGHTVLSDGRILVAGGTGGYDKVIVNGVMHDGGHGFAGTRDVAVFDPVQERWTAVRPLAHGRWYPTILMLKDGAVLAASGLDEHGDGHANNTLERAADPERAAWATTRDFNLPLYPHLFPLADGRLVYTGGKMDTVGDSVPFLFDPVHPTASPVIDGLTDAGQCNQSASVVLPPAQAYRFMILGGGPEDDTAERGQATRRVAVVDCAAAKPVYQTRARLNHERMHVNAVLLPDRTVLAVGGGVTREASVHTKVVDPQGGREVVEAELYEPVADRWSVTAPATIARLYHSVALLLPDGRVVAAGGNPDKGSQVNWLPADPLEEMRLEIYSPPYLFASAPRPSIMDAPREITYGANVVVRTAQTQSIKWVDLIRPGLTTHSFDSTQRLVDVPFTVTPPDRLRATIPDDRGAAPPGWYMLFLINTQGVPSVASWVHLS